MRHSVVAFRSKLFAMTQPTQPLYYQTSDLHFSAQVIQTDGPKVALSATAFYPEGGGQNADVGVLGWVGGAAKVVDVQKDKATGLIWHTLAGDLPPVGARVRGEVDAGTRWRNMQRHSGEHLLAAAFYKHNPAFGVAAVSMRQPECTLDLMGQPAEADLQAAEGLLRQTLGRQELSLRIAEVDETELERYPLRRGSKVRGRVRLVIFEDAAGQIFDVSACGGLHVPAAAQALPVVILRSERIKGDLTRVTFMAGEEAGEYLSRVQAQARQLAVGFSVGIEALPERVNALRDEAQKGKAQAEALRAELAALRVQALAAETLGQFRLRSLHLAAAEAGLLPEALKAVPAGEVLVVTVQGGRCGVGSGVPGLHAGEVLRAALQVSGGKGGGRPEAAQGQAEDVGAFVDAVRAALGEG